MLLGLGTTGRSVPRPPRPVGISLRTGAPSAPRPRGSFWQRRLRKAVRRRAGVVMAFLRSALPIIGLGFALVITAAWIGLLGYGVFELVELAL
jgi:hypothetical protein